MKDFQSKDINIERWNGKVLKQNVKLKASALEAISMSTLGVPLNVKKGVIGKLEIVIPYTRLMSQPCEVYLTDLHLVCTSNPKYDSHYVKRKLLMDKKGRVSELVMSVKVSCFSNETGIAK